MIGLVTGFRLHPCSAAEYNPQESTIYKTVQYADDHYERKLKINYEFIVDLVMFVGEIMQAVYHKVMLSRRAEDFIVVRIGHRPVCRLDDKLGPTPNPRYILLRLASHLY